MKEVVTFFLSGKKYGVEVSRLQGLENYQELSPVEDMPDFLLGVIKVRDEIIPVMNIKKRLVLPNVAVSRETKYLVFRMERGNFAVMADGVAEIMRVEGNDLQDFPSLMNTEATSYVDFVANQSGQLVLVVKPEGLLTDEEWGKVEKMLEGIREE